MIFAGALLLCTTACVQQRERAEQQNAVEYNIRQRASAKCADTGLLPGSASFNDCVAKLEGAP